MYTGFNLRISQDEKEYIVEEFEKYFRIGKALYDARKTEIATSLDAFIGAGGELDGTALQGTWFPKIEADIFLSHSHKDETLAITLAGFLYSVFNIKCFIDSTVWGYSNKLLKTIDDNYCSNKPKENTYNYDKRNLSTSHVHMMLASSLAAMIDKTECLFFLNTPNSITPNEVIDKTASPWIYNEVLISTLIRKRSPEAHRRVVKLEKGGTIAESRNFSFTYDLNLSHLGELDTSSLDEWREEWTTQIPKPSFALDILYNQHGPTILRD